MAYGSGATAATTVAIAQAIKAYGATVSMKPDDFMTLINKMEAPLVVVATGGMFNKNYQYLTGYKGLTFHTKSSEKLPLPLETELITVNKMWIPN